MPSPAPSPVTSLPTSSIGKLTARPAMIDPAAKSSWPTISGRTGPSRSDHIPLITIPSSSAVSMIENARP